MYHIKSRQNRKALHENALSKNKAKKKPKLLWRMGYSVWCYGFFTTKLNKHFLTCMIRNKP